MSILEILIAILNYLYELILGLINDEFGEE